MRIPTILAAVCLMLVSCQPQEGCTDPTANNYDSNAVEDDGSCDDRPEFDGYTYDVTTIGEQVWFAENLQTTVYANGSGIPEVTSNSLWDNPSNGARCVYENEESNVAIYGRLYNYNAASDPRGLCPSGWHVPSDQEWDDLENYIIAQGFDGATSLKSTYGWANGGNGTDKFGFMAFPGGTRASGNGVFYYAGTEGYWWSSEGIYRAMFSNGPHIYEDIFNGSEQAGHSVRCLKDTE